MAFDKTTRNHLAGMVAECRRLLSADIGTQLQSVYGIQPDGTASDVTKLRLDDRGREIATALRQWLDHLAVSDSSGDEATRRKNAVFRIKHETAFTFLNRLAAMRTCECPERGDGRRGLIIECVSKGMESAGFQLYEQLARNAIGDRETTYRVFLEHMFDELAIDLGLLFDRRAVQSLIFPGPDCLKAVVTELNKPDVANLWKLDETIGWIYQDFNDEKERREMRKVSAPRNSRELAVRNQFFTPRYVVKFLTDNTLGRIWYEMRTGQTAITDECEFLVRRMNEVFLSSGQQPPASDDDDTEPSLEDDFFVPYRAKKDPRDLKVLDPACGSGHFLLYAFDLLETIYLEAWEDQRPPASEATGRTLKVDYPTEDELRRAIPELILRHNLHGIDVDSRACQIASLALWLRAQRSYEKLQISPADRPRIGKSNIVTAEPMPGEEDLRAEFIATLQPPLLGQLVERVFESMELAGEAGSLLKVDELISESIAAAQKEWTNQWEKARDKQGNELLFSVGELDAIKEDKQQTLDFSDVTDDQFWHEAESRIVDALRRYADQATNGASVRRGLFQEDAAQGFAFIDVCRNRYDVVLMNPPFGEPPVKCEKFFDDAFTLTSNDLYGMFFERTLQWLSEGGKVGAITNRTWLGLPTFEELRTNVFTKLGAIETAADLGSFVLEAQVETIATIIGKGATEETEAIWTRLLKTRRKEEMLSEIILQVQNGTLHPSAFIANAKRFLDMPKAVYGYWMSTELIELYSPKHAIKPDVADVKQGLASGKDFRFLRLAWEVPPSELSLQGTWPRFAKGGEYSPFFDDIHLTLKWIRNGEELIALGSGRPQNTQFFGSSGITWPRRTTSPFGPRVFSRGCAFGDKGPAAITKAGYSPAVLLGILTTRPSRLLLSVRLGAGDNAPGSASKSYEVGLIGALPYPDLSDDAERRIGELTNQAIDAVRIAQFDVDETTTGFTVPPAVKFSANTIRQSTMQWVVEREHRLIQWSESEQGLDRVVAAAFGFTESDFEIMSEELEFPLNQLECVEAIDADVFRDAYLTKKVLPGDRLPGGEDASADVRVESRRKKQQSLRSEATICRLFEITPARFAELRQEAELLRSEDLQEVAAGTLSYLVGAAFGRWDLRKAIDPNLRPDLADPFAELPACSPGMLVGDDGLPLTAAPASYPITIADNGILVDDPGLDGHRPHDSDIVSRVRDGIAQIWPHHAEAIELEICQTLGVQSIREFFRTPSHFFAHHLSRYKKSRRQAPIYWPLSTASGSYTVWVYYHRLTDQTIYTIVNQYLELGKIDEVQRAVTRTEEELAGASGAEQTRLKDQLTEQQAFLNELNDLKTELLRIADLPYRPDLNDGVIINAAPLHELFRHRPWSNDCEECWQSIESGEYDWSHLAFNIRTDEVTEKCRSDRSLAIAHDREELFVASAAPKRSRKKKA
ncbi:hypothetical protein K227x_05780 [Rubripirellula lacrimiformis]|uniref:site-specific DNA-methyltransferase (adenine-specific) n=1 Tax=Rubripirellula lacrimiformis TaxID=1930273 RepID=A0A517N4Z0_9BACT|nr:BREX-1 system adenine-specific DNA-methyltransferase PglX [Rubripirellula lacrimiformis]QDT02206.1 hypothetical protein K227x_05780 [Rubripirellula lacrimiformis]